MMVFIRYFLLGSISLTALNSRAFQSQEQLTCLEKAGFAMANSAETLDRSYKNLSEAHSGIRAGIREGNGPGIMIGNRDKAVILLHGFMASPFEVVSLGWALNEKGYTVYFPLIPGFGGTVDVANQSTTDAWKQVLPDAVRALSPCYKNIAIVGFSLGGTIALDFLFHEVQLDGTYSSINGDVKVTSITLLSPFIAPKIPLLRWIAGFTSIFTESLDAKKMAMVAAGQDLDAILKYPNYYLPEIPLDAAVTAMKFGKTLDHVGDVQSKVPAFLAYSDYDRTVDPFSAQSFVLQHFQQFWTKGYKGNLKIPHQIALPSNLHHESRLYESIANFIELHD